MPKISVGTRPPPLLRVVRAFRSDHAADVAGTELRFLLAGLNRVPVGDPVDDRPAQARDHADDHTDDRAADRKEQVPGPVANAIQPARAQRAGAGNGFVVPQQRDDLRDGENPQADDDQLQAVDQIRDFVGRHAQAAGRPRFADGPDQQSQAGRGNPFQRQPPRQDRDHRQTEDRDHQHFGQSEGQHQRAGNQDEEGEHGGAEESAEQRRRERRRQCPGGLAFLGERKPVEHGCLAGGGSGDAHQDRGEGIGGGDHRNQPHHQRQARDGVHAEHERQDQRQARNAAEPRKHPDRQTEQDAQHQEHDLLRLQDQGKRIAERRKRRRQDVHERVFLGERHALRTQLRAKGVGLTSRRRRSVLQASSGQRPWLPGRPRSPASGSPWPGCRSSADRHPAGPSKSPRSRRARAPC